MEESVSEAPIMVATGILNSCEIELNRALYNLSDSSRTEARRARSFRNSRSRALEICVRNVFQNNSSSSEKVLVGLTATTPTRSLLAVSGKKVKSPEGKVSVNFPAFFECWNAHDATLISLSERCRSDLWLISFPSSLFPP